ncbi:fused MFS/spermidine synthase [Streptomyces sp. DSM 44917]|uniref:Fused MFS/spermidine synthase n=1 Tax=Streptomyces boetiae TaxID=3075541 RepID=A0ABU2L8A1_9ACTN|nr:fused MFS/spermidine synthase [Streptomyces sp. DSM 44917]MDT0307791.1 fused MFS/spermidine synthase [Streptomyces sp. DSM 44917]
MARRPERRNGRQRAAAGPTEAVDGGQARLVPDPGRSRAYELLLDGAPQSHVDLAEPTRLAFEYQRRLGHLADLAAPPRQPLTVLHLGGGGLTLARYVAVTRPRSSQQVAEPDARLTAFVRRELPLPGGARIRVRALDAREFLARAPEGLADLVIADVFAGARTPAHCTSAEFVDLARRALRPGGWYAANVADGPPLAHLRGQAATLLSRFGHVALAAEPGTLRGRRFGNGVLCASDGPLPVAELASRCARDPLPARLLAGRELEDFTAGAPVVTDPTAAASPPPPPGTFA